MSNPTATWSWTLPTRNLDPWYTAFIDAFGQMDATVFSLTALSRARNRVTTVFSVIVPDTSPLQTIRFNPGSTGSPYSLTVVSLNPFGALQGTFTLQSSGAFAVLDFRCNITQAGILLPPVFDVGNTYAYYRLVLNGTNIQSFAVVTDTQWVLPLMSVLRTGNMFAATATVSLQPGTYNTVFEMRGFSTAGSESFGFNDGAVVMLSALEATR